MNTTKQKLEILLLYSFSVTVSTGVVLLLLLFASETGPFPTSRNTAVQAGFLIFTLAMVLTTFRTSPLSFLDRAVSILLFYVTFSVIVGLIFIFLYFPIPHY